MASKAGAEDDFSTMSIVNELKEVGHDDMYSLGVQLGIPTSILKKFEHDFHGRTDRFQLEVIDYWHNNEKLSWSKLAEALEKVGGYTKIVARLRSKTQDSLHDHPRKVYPRLACKFPEQTDSFQPQLVQRSQSLVTDALHQSHAFSSKSNLGGRSQSEKRLPTQPTLSTIEHPTPDTALQDVSDSLQNLKLAMLHKRIRPLPVEDAQYLKFVQENGELREAEAAVSSITVQDSEVCLVGNEDQLKKANTIIDAILASRKEHKERIPSHISYDIGHYCDRCQREKKVLVIYQCDNLKQRQFRFISNSERRCKEALEWMKTEVYPEALTFLGRGKKVKKQYCEPLSQVQREHISEVHSELKSVFGVSQDYQAKLKVGYEARFGQFVEDTRPTKAQMKKYFFKPSVDPNNVKRVIATKCTATSDQLEYTVISPLKISVTPKSGGEPTTCIAVVEELPGGTYHLNQVFHERPPCLPKFDFAFERMNIGMRIAPCISSVINDDSEECQAVRNLVRTIRRRGDGKLTMLARGSTEKYTYCVEFMRLKRQAQHRWKDFDKRKRWILAEYGIQEFDIKKHEHEQWECGERIVIEFEEHKELELWSWKRFGPFIKSSDITRTHYAEVEGAFIPGEDEPQQVSPWTVDEILYGFDEFVQASTEIAECLSS